MNNRSLEQSIKEKISHVIDLIPKNGEVKYLPLTNQLLISFEDSNEFDSTLAQKIGDKFGNSEVVTVKTGYRRYANFILINQFDNTLQPSSEAQDNLIAIKILVTYALKNEKDRINSIISKETAGAATYRAPIDKHEEIWFSSLQKSLEEISNADLIRQINDLKKHTKEEQRNMIYWSLGVPFSVYGETSGSVELLLRKLPQIDVNKIQFGYIKGLNIKYPNDITINLIENITTQYPSAGDSKSAVNNSSRLFSGIEQNEQHDINSLKIKDLDLTITEFNQRYDGRYSITKGQDLTWNGFWLIKNNKDEICGVFYPENNQLCEKQHSTGKYNFIHKIQNVGNAATNRK